MSRPIVVDLFCGGGGASTGIEAGGLHVDVAVNHDEAAILMHERNHRRTTHLRRSVWDVSPRAVARGRPVRLLWASPDCTHHSRALGGKPREKGIRDLAWVVVDWCRDVRPAVVMLENVPEFLDWGPLYEKQHLEYDVPTREQAKLHRPIPERKGEIFLEFIAHLRLHGYRVEWRKLCAADYGAPTIRTRLFLIARCDGEPIVWPDPSHAKGGAGGLQPWRSAAECIDWSIPTKSIFGRKKPLADATQRRIAEGLRRYVLTTAQPFLVKFYGKSTAATLSDPMHTVTTSTGHLGLAAPSLVKFYGTSMGAAVDAPLPTVTAGGGRGGGHVALMAPTLIQTGYGEREGQAPRCLDIGAPLGTIVAGGAKHAVVSAWMAKHYTGAIGHDLNQPLSTVTAVDHHSLCTATLGPAEAEGARRVAAFLVQYYGSGGQWAKLDEPMRTIVTKARMGLVTVEIEGEPWAIVDIGLRMLTPRELARAQGFPDAYDLLEDELTLAEQIEKIGNSVCPDIPAALVRANITGERRKEAA